MVELVYFELIEMFFEHIKMNWGLLLVLFFFLLFDLFFLLYAYAMHRHRIDDNNFE